MIVSLEELQIEIDKGNVKKQDHPTLPISIYKYTPQCVYTKAWNKTTLICRGLVVDQRNGYVVINPMPKFFNYDEIEGTEVLLKNIGNKYTVTEKLDGSLIQATYYENEVIVTSSGSFTSPQALKAKELLESYSTSPARYIHKGHTCVFEIIYPQNRIVVNYGDTTKLTLITMRNNFSGAEYGTLFYHQLFPKEIDVVKEVPLTILDLEKEMDREDYINKEGFIVMFSSGDRVKFKYDEYMRLHKIISNINEKYIWLALKEGRGLTLENVPDELFNFCKETIKKLEERYSKITAEARDLYEKVVSMEYRKDQAIFILNTGSKVAPVVFAMLDGRDTSQRIWDLIEPENSKKFGAGES